LQLGKGRGELLALRGIQLVQLFAELLQIFRGGLGITVLVGIGLSCGGPGERSAERRERGRALLVCRIEL
jgi:hypothetical protein